MLPVGALPDVEQFRIYDAMRRLRYNVRVLIDEAPKFYKDDNPFRVNGYSYANFLSSAHSLQDILVSISKKYDPHFHKTIGDFVASDELLCYVRESRNAEDHSKTGTETRKVAGWAQPMGIGITFGPDGVPVAFFGAPHGGPIAVKRHAFKLMPIALRGGKTLPVPTTHLGEPVDNVTPQSLARLAASWWIPVSMMVSAGVHSLPNEAFRKCRDWVADRPTG